MWVTHSMTAFWSVSLYSFQYEYWPSKTYQRNLCSSATRHLHIRSYMLFSYEAGHQETPPICSCSAPHWVPLVKEFAIAFAHHWSTPWGQTNEYIIDSKDNIAKMKIGLSKTVVESFYWLISFRCIALLHSYECSNIAHITNARTCKYNRHIHFSIKCKIILLNRCRSKEEEFN